MDSSVDHHMIEIYCFVDEFFKAHPARLSSIDSKPIPLCTPIRHGWVRLLRDEGAYFGKSNKGWFFGFKPHLLLHPLSGTILLLLSML